MQRDVMQMAGNMQLVLTALPILIRRLDNRRAPLKERINAEGAISILQSPWWLLNGCPGSLLQCHITPAVLGIPSQPLSPVPAHPAASLQVDFSSPLQVNSCMQSLIRPAAA